MLQRSFLHGLFACVFVFTGFTVSSVVAEDKLEYAVKAGNIGNIVGFITWPSKQAKTEVCVLGDNPILSIADSIQKKFPSISLVKETNIGKISSHCHAVFIGVAEGDEYKDTLNILKNRPILTIGDAPDFAERGGMVMLAYQGGRIKAVINKGVVESSGLRADPLMLESSVFKVIDD